MPRGDEGDAPDAREVPLSPQDALRRVAYLLERSRAETYKVRAFRRAAATIDSTDPERLRRLAHVGRLTDLEGVGATTAKVIAEALAGEVPSYQRQLEAEAGTPGTRGDGGAQASEKALELRRALRGDCHSHSDWSDGGSPIEEMALTARALGHDYWALTDHSPRLTVAHGLDRERLLRQLAIVDRLNEELDPFRVLSGIEVDILEDGTLDQDEDLLARLDVVVASVHSKLRMPPEEMTLRMVRAVESPHVDILGHCTGRLIVGRGRPQSAFDPERVFGACARTDTAVEINSRPERRDPPPDLLRAAEAMGCVFSVDTDAHAPAQLEWQDLGCEQAVDAGIDASRVVNARPLSELLAWTAGHSA